MPAKKKLIDEAAVAPEAVAPAAPGVTRLVTTEDLEKDREFVASLDALGAVEEDMPEATVAEDRQPTDHATVDRPDAAPVRGGVNALVTRLLADPTLSYEAIVEAVRAEHPGAQTTARSVASTASVLRRKGTPVPMRRGPKA
jgi:hypothetical protein